ncbi:MAG: mechanosensitive ion channel family protein [Lachnospiraceae bacterium]|nr:mechanosensitive ion channel family protein [Lachnospiraceae bacterium]
MTEFIINRLPDGLESLLREYSSGEIVTTLIVMLLLAIILLAAYIGSVFLIMKLVGRLFRHIEKKKGSSITWQFLHKAITLVLVIVFVVLPLGGESLARSLLGSTAVMAAVVGLAANDVIKDMFSGLEISVYKPFDVGSRIMLDDGRAGIVEKLTLRHVVLKLVDTTRLIVPNSKANSAIITNYSYEDYVPRSLEVFYPISFDADIDKAKKVIRETICKCPLTLNEDRYLEKDPNSRCVYFLELKDSAILLGATVYYPHEVRTEVVKDEVNTSVVKALAANNIEIPYSYVNVRMKEA